ncbi:MAG: Bax inhibitor-1/YccA family protein [Sphaerochaetaceae bacterium]
MTEQKAQMLHNVDVRERSIVKNVYVWMTAALAITALVSYVVAANPGLMKAMLGNSFSFILLIIAEFALVIFLSSRLESMSQNSAIGAFLAYSVLNGILFSTIFMVYSGAVISKAFVSAAMMFAGMSVYAMTTKRDLSGWGYYLMVSLWGLIIASVMNMFFHSTGMEYLLSYLGVGIFLGLTAWDTSKLVKVNDQYGSSMDEATYTKVSIMFALSLYLDFLNIFLYLLRIFGRSSNR